MHLIFWMGLELKRVIWPPNWELQFMDHLKRFSSVGQQAKGQTARGCCGFNSVSSRASNIIIPFHKSLFRPHLEYAVQFLSPYLKKDIQLLEKVQHRARRMIQGLAGPDYDARLRNLNMCTLQERRIREGLIHLFNRGRGYWKSGFWC